MHHESVRSGTYAVDEIHSVYGEDVAGIIKGLIRVNDLYSKSPTIESENFRNLLLSFAEDMQVILLGTPITYVMIGLNNVMRATGNPKKAMLTSMVTVLCNIILAPLFIFHFNWGIRGAATATVISQFIGMVSPKLREMILMRFEPRPRNNVLMT